MTTVDDPAGSGGEFQTVVADGVCRFWRPHRPTRFLSTGFDGGERVANAAYNVTVPTGWGDDGHRDLRAYVSKRVTAAGFGSDSVTQTEGSTRTGDRERPAKPPALLTGVDQQHARVARLEGATVLATAGVSNPAALPVPPAATDDPPAATDDPSVTGGRDERGRRSRDQAERDRPAGRRADGTVNLLVGVDRPLEPGALANLVSVVAEAKAATLLATVGVPGTTSDAVIVGCPPTSAPGSRSTARFSGSATPVGATVRASVRDALCASLRSRYGPDLADAPSSVAAAEYGVSTEHEAAVSVPPTR